MSEKQKKALSAAAFSAAALLCAAYTLCALCGCASPPGRAAGRNGAEKNAGSVGRAPYAVSGEMRLGSSVGYTTAGFDFLFCNRAEKNVTGFTVVFALFDSDGDPPFFGADYMTQTFRCILSPQENAEFAVSLDSYLDDVPDEPYLTDYLYAARIEYEDGSVWEDPFGRAVF